MMMVLSGGWLVDAFESSSPSKSAQSFARSPGASEHSVHFACLQAYNNNYAELDPLTLQEVSKCRHTKSVPIMGLKFKKKSA